MRSFWSCGNYFLPRRDGDGELLPSFGEKGSPVKRIPVPQPPDVRLLSRKKSNAHKARSQCHAWMRSEVPFRSRTEFESVPGEGLRIAKKDGPRYLAKLLFEFKTAKRCGK